MVCALPALLSLPAVAQDASPAAGHSWAAFAQVGSSEHTRQVTVGVQVPWFRSWRLGSGDVNGYWDFSLSRWRYPEESGGRHGLLSQLGVTPALRWSPGGRLGSTFMEVGVGITWMSDLYRTPDKDFSTRFNFGSHLAVGWPLDDRHAQELVIRLEHFSNGGIRRPNPGEDFLQLRYVQRF